MKVVCNFNTLEDYLNNFWDGGLDTVKMCQAAGKGAEFIALMEQHIATHIDAYPTVEHLNDFAWFERDSILEALDINLDELDFGEI